MKAVEENRRPKTAGPVGLSRDYQRHGKIADGKEDEAHQEAARVHVAGPGHERRVIGDLNEPDDNKARADP